MSSGLSHITLIVTDLDETQVFLEAAFRARCVYRSDDDVFVQSETRFFLIGDVWLAIIQGITLPNRTYNHIAFKIADTEYEACQSRLEAMQIEMLPSRPRIVCEGRSLYFYGPDNHLFELHTGTLEQRLARYAQAVTR